MRGTYILHDGNTFWKLTVVKLGAGYDGEVLLAHTCETC